MRINNSNYDQYRLLELLMLDESLTYKEMAKTIGVTDKTCKRWRERIKAMQEIEADKKKIEEQSEIEMLKLKHSEIAKKIEDLKSKFILDINKLISEFKNTEK